MLRPLILTLFLAACSGGDGDTDTSVVGCDDADGDGICDVDDACTGDDASGDTDADGVCDSDDLCTGDDEAGDSDLDGICDGPDDLCAGDDATGDTDLDGVCDDRDLCTGDDALGDADQDGTCDDAADLCFGDDTTGDSDSDGVCDNADQCTGDDATGDSDFDGTCDDGDACTGDDTTGDTDDDGVCDDSDACTGDDSTGDADNDGVCADLDFCTGNDATGDADVDGVCDNIDACIGDDASGNVDGDGRCDDIDDCNGTDEDDDDGDGVCNSEDVCVGQDTTGDGDGDGVCDSDDVCSGDDASGDTDSDGICEDQDTCIGPDGAGDPDSDGFCGSFDRCVGDDGVGDFDNDGECDDTDLCLGNNTLGDEDGDGLCDGVYDACIGDDATGDTDGDGICNDIDVCYGNNDFGHDRGDGICGTGVIWYVRGGAGFLNRGRSWNDPFPSLDRAMQSVETGDTVFVDVGTRSNMNYDDLPNISAGVQVIGGFTASEAHPDDRSQRSSGVNSPTLITAAPTLIVSGGFVDGFEYSGVSSPALLVGNGGSIANITVTSPDTRNNSPSILFSARTQASAARVRCVGFAAQAGPCFESTAAGLVEIDDLYTSGMSGSSQPVARVASGRFRIRDFVYENATRSFLSLASGAEVLLIDGVLDSIEPSSQAVVFMNGGSELTVTDVEVVATGVSGTLDTEGGLFYAVNSTLNLDRVHVDDTAVGFIESVSGGIAYVADSTFTMTDSAVGRTALNGDGGVLGGLFYLSDSQSSFQNVSLEGPAGGASEAKLFYVDSGELIIDNSVIYDTVDGGFLVTAGTQVNAGPVGARAGVLGVLRSSNPIELTASPWSAADFDRLYLVSTSECVDAGDDRAADAADVWWPGRVAAANQGIDVPPVDLGVHYDEDVSP